MGLYSFYFVSCGYTLCLWLNKNVFPDMTGGSSAQGGVITSELSGGGLKITYEKQQAVANNVQVELERITPTPMEQQPAKRSR